MGSVTYRVLVTGSRNWANSDLVRLTLDQARLLHGRRLVVVHGACPNGVDAVADEWALENHVERDPYPADWTTYGKGAGQIRNAEMVRLGADECVAFIARCIQPSCRRKTPHGSHGATYCAELAEAALIPTRRWTMLGSGAAAASDADGPALF